VGWSGLACATGLPGPSRELQSQGRRVAKRKCTHVAASTKEALAHVAYEAALALLAFSRRLLLLLAVVVAIREVVVPPVVGHREKHGFWLPERRGMENVCLSSALDRDRELKIARKLGVRLRLASASRLI
jgi:hypothetical protein